jgi:hypothetical protein
MHASVLTRLLQLPQKDALERYQASTWLNHLECSVHASKEVEPGQLVDLGIVDTDILVAFRWYAWWHANGQAKPFAVLGTVLQQMCIQLEWIAKYSVVKAATISTIRMRRGFHSAIVQGFQFDRWRPLQV